MSAEQTPDIETVNVIREVIKSAQASAVESPTHIARAIEAALAPVLAAADERAYLRGYEAGLLAPQSEWMKARDRDLRKAEQRALREAADSVMRHGSDGGPVRLVTVRRWLLDRADGRADRVAEPQHGAATVKGCTCGPDGTLAECAAELAAGGWCPRAAVVRAAQHEAATSSNERGLKKMSEYAETFLVAVMERDFDRSQELVAAMLPEVRSYLGSALRLAISWLEGAGDE